MSECNLTAQNDSDRVEQMAQGYFIYQKGKII